MQSAPFFSGVTVVHAKEQMVTAGLLFNCQKSSEQSLMSFSCPFSLTGQPDYRPPYEAMRLTGCFQNDHHVSMSLCQNSETEDSQRLLSVTGHFEWEVSYSSFQEFNVSFTYERTISL